MRRVTRQQPRPGDGRIRHRAQPLGEILEPVLCVRMRPGVVEDELTMRVLLQVRRRGGDEFIALPQGEVVRRPAPLRPQAAMLLKTGQECMRDEWIAAVVQRIPSLGWDLH